MSSPPPTIPAGLPVGAAIEHFLGGHDGEAFPVVTDAGVVGFVSLRTAQAIPPDRPVADATVGLEGIAEAGPDDPMSLVSERLGDGRKRTVLVMEGNRLVGVIEPEDLARLFRRGVAPAPGAPTRP
jgi:CBS domain-containing protein